MSRFYRVEFGDTLQSIAQRMGVDFNALAEHVGSTEVFPGLEIDLEGHTHTPDDATIQFSDYDQGVGVHTLRTAKCMGCGRAIYSLIERFAWLPWKVDAAKYDPWDLLPLSIREREVAE